MSFLSPEALLHHLTLISLGHSTSSCALLCRCPSVGFPRIGRWSLHTHWLQCTMCTSIVSKRTLRIEEMSSGSKMYLLLKTLVHFSTRAATNSVFNNVEQNTVCAAAQNVKTIFLITWWFDNSQGAMYPILFGHRWVNLNVPEISVKHAFQGPFRRPFCCHQRHPGRFLGRNRASGLWIFAVDFVVGFGNLESSNNLNVCEVEWQESFHFDI